jgi:hypothetical protein
MKNLRKLVKLLADLNAITAYNAQIFNITKKSPLATATLAPINNFLFLSIHRVPEFEDSSEKQTNTNVINKMSLRGAKRRSPAKGGTSLLAVARHDDVKLFVAFAIISKVLQFFSI